MEGKKELIRKNFKISEISPSEWYSINQFILEIEKTDNPCISLYFPHNKKSETIQLLRETKRKIEFEKIELAIEERILKLNNNSTKKFVNTHCIFGWQINGKIRIKEISISKKLPYVYVAGKKPYLKPFYDILKINYKTMLVILDQKSAKIKLLHGNKIIKEERLSINLQGRHKKGGQSQKRFLRARQTFIQGFYKRIAKKITKLDSNDVEILLLGGIGNAKIEFHDELTSELKKKCRFVNNISFNSSTHFIDKKIIENLYDYRRRYVLELISKFEKLVKEKLVIKRNSDIQKALEIGAVDTLLISAHYFHSIPKSKKIIKMIEMAENTSAKIEFVTNPRLVEKLEKYEHVLALIRYRF